MNKAHRGRGCACEGMRLCVYLSRKVSRVFVHFSGAVKQCINVQLWASLNELNSGNVNNWTICWLVTDYST
jgi:hypothetical protein